ncbi:MAG: adenosine deaminase [Terriglobales bacterium]
MDPQLRHRLQRLPKAELHLHLEGTIQAATLWQLSRRYDFPFGLRDQEACEAVYCFEDFTGFLQAFKMVSQHLRTPQDYALAVRAMARDLAAQGVVYAEVFLSLGILNWKQMPVAPVWQAVQEASVQARLETGVQLGWLFDAVRQFGAGAAERVLSDCLLRKSDESVLGVGLGGDEAAGPAPWFRDVYREAKRAGLRRTVHAGESCGPDSIWSAINDLDAERIGHGLRAIEDSRLLEHLSRHGVYLDVCPTSNVKTGCIAAIADHPILQFFERGVPFAISTDDPAFFRVTLMQELETLHDVFGFTEPDLVTLLHQSFSGSFLPEADKQAWQRRLSSMASAPGPTPAR